MEPKREDRDRPLLEVAKRGEKATSAQTFGNIVVCMLGPGVLGLPYAFQVAGWLAGSVGLLSTALVTYYCMLLLVECRRKIEDEEQESEIPAQVQSYGDVGANAFGVTGRILTETLILVAHAGASVAFLIFVGQNISTFIDMVPNYSISSSVLIILLVLLPVEILLSFLRSLALLAPFSVFATFCNVSAMAVVIKGDIDQLKDHSLGPRTVFNGAWSIPFACGVAVFCFSGVGMTLPLEGSMAKRKRFPWVLLQAFTGVGLAYVCFGTAGYLAFGEDTKEIITLNLPNDWAAVVVKVGLCIASAFTIPLVVHPIHEIIELKLKSSGWFCELCHKSQVREWLVSQVARVLVVAVLGVLATSAPGFTQMIAFIGSTVSAIISFVLPTSFHLKIMGSALSVSRKVIDYCILLVGLMSALYGIYTAFQAVL